MKSQWLPILALLFVFSCLLSTALAVAQETEPTPTEAAAPTPSDTSLPPTDTPVPAPTDTPASPPTATSEPPGDTPVPPTDTPVPSTNTPVPPTDTPVPSTDTPVPPTDIPVSTDTPFPTDTPTDTPVPTDTPTETPIPTETPTPTATLTPTIILTPTATSTPSLSPVLTTDQSAYISGHIVVITGQGFAPDTTYDVPIIRPNGTMVKADGSFGWDAVTTDASGAFTYTYPISDLLGGYSVEVYQSWAGQGSGQTPMADAGFVNVEAASLIVRLAAGLSDQQQQEVITRNGGVETSAVPALRMHFVNVPSNTLADSMQRLRNNPQVVSVETDKVREAGADPSDPAYPDQWALPRIGWTTVFSSVNPTGSSVIAILDTGVDAGHPDLSGLVWPGFSAFEGGNAWSDPNGHGTRMAGIAAALTDNNAGIAGVAYGGVSILPVQVLDASGLGQDSDIISGVVWATDQGADVILMAFSNPGYSPALQMALDYAWDHGVVLVAAVGNDDVSTPTYPAGDRAVMGISATDQSDALAPTSNYGPTVFMAAPGVDIRATEAGGGVTSVTGTSASAAEVAGAAALLRAVDPGLSNGVVVGRLARTADPAGTQEQTGNGRLNLARALSDTGVDEVKPAGAVPNGNGGPYVGPYAAATAGGSLSINDTAITEIDDGTNTITFTVTFTRTSNGMVSANYATADGPTNPATGGAACTAGVDYISKNGVITYNSDSAGTQIITVTICGDLLAEPSETLFVNLSNPVDLTITYNQGLGTIIDNDSGTIAKLIVNEIDYDQPGADNAEFIELKNVSDVTINLDPYSVRLVNGNLGGAVIYDTINLPSFSLAPGAYYVICANAANTLNCNLDVTPNSSLIQNGAPDAVAVVFDNVILDTVSYEGNTGAPYTEGAGVGLEDDSAVLGAGISRFPDMVDTDQNNVDWSLRCITPGQPNTIASSNCVALALDNVAGSMSYDEVNDVISYLYTLTNTGFVTLTSPFTVTDNIASDELCPQPATLAPNAALTCTASYTITQADLDSGSVTNTATGQATFDSNLVNSNQDQETVMAVQNPAIDIDKTPDIQQIAPGETVTFTIKVTNTGNVTLINVTVTDLNAPNCAATYASLAPGGMQQYTCTHGNVTADFTNSATATGTPPTGPDVNDTDTADVDVLPTITVTKTADPTSVNEPGGTVTFTLTISNTSAEIVTLDSLTDTVYGNLNGQGSCATGGIIAAGSHFTCAFTATVSGNAGDSETDVVTAIAFDNEGNDATDNDDAIVTIEDVPPSVTLSKKADPTTLAEPGGVFTFTLIMENSSVETVTITALTDSRSGVTDFSDCDDLVDDPLASGASTTCIYTVTHTDAGVYTNTASVIVEDNEGNPDNDTDEAEVEVTDVEPTLTVEKTANPTDVPYTGGMVIYTVEVTNNSPEPITLTSLVDDKVGDLDGQGTCAVPQPIAVSDSYTCAFTAAVSGNPGNHVNTVKATAKDDEGNETTDTDDATVLLSKPAIAIDKQGPVLAYGGGVVTYTYTVTNAGNVPLSNITVSDDKCGAASYTSGDVNNDGKLDPTETWLFKCAYTPGFYAVWPNTVLKNVATATGQFKEQQVLAQDDYKLYPFFLRKKIFLYWDSPANTVSYKEPDNTPFTVKIYKGNTLIATVTVSANSPQALWLSEGAYTFEEVNLPSGYVAGHTSVHITTGKDYPDWTLPNIITFDLAVKKSGPAYAFKGNTITYAYTVTNAGPASVAPTISDNKCSPITFLSGDSDHDGLIDPDEVWSYKCNYTITQGPDTTIKNIVTVDDVFTPAPGWYLGGDRNPKNNTATWQVWVRWYGCTPGFWKQTQHFNKWPASYASTTQVASVFTVPSYLLKSGKLDLNNDGKADTLLNALNYQGTSTVAGGAQILLRAAVAGLLNEVAFGDQYPAYTSKQALIKAVNSALVSKNRTTMINLANTLDKWNNGYCPY